MCTCNTAGQTACSTGCTDVHWDANNCGSCGHAYPGPNAYCSYGSCAVLTELAPNTWAAGRTHSIVVDASNAYWDDNTHLNQVALGGGVVAILAASGGGDLAVDGSYVYYTSNNHVISRVPIGGGSVSTIATIGCAPNLAMDPTSLYYICGGLYRVPKTGGTPVELSTNDGNGELALGNGKVYWGSYNGALYEIAVTGGSPTALVQGRTNFQGVAVDSANVYWAENNNPGNVMQLSLSGSLPQTLASGQNGPYELIADATNVYWRDANGTIWRLPIGGGTPTPVTQTSNGAMAVDATSLYFTGSPVNGAGNDLYKLTPK
jgi:hypothetical protein